MVRNHSNNPRMPIYWELRGFSPEDSKIRAKTECRNGSVRCIEYWIKKGFSPEEAKKEVKRIQDNGKYLKGRTLSEEQKKNLRILMKKLHTIEYWTEKYGKNDGSKKFENLKNNQIKNAKKSHKARLKNDPNTYINSSIRRPEYWIKQGYTEEEAKIIISKKQSRSLDFYITKYGEDEGTKKWKNRHEKWYKSFYESGKDLDLINVKRKLNSHVGYYTKDLVEKNDQLNFYLILLNDNENQIIKYGLTKQNNITKRWKVSLNYNLILFNKMNAYDAIDLENKFHEIFKNTYSPSIIKTTECFLYTDKNLNEAMSILKKYNIINLNEVKQNG